MAELQSYSQRLLDKNLMDLFQLLGLTGENLVERVSAPEGDWYKDRPTLIEAIDLFSPPLRLIEKPFRMSISDVYKVTDSKLVLRSWFFVPHSATISSHIKKKRGCSLSIP